MTVGVIIYIMIYDNVNNCILLTLVHIMVTGISMYYIILLYTNVLYYIILH